MQEKHAVQQPASFHVYNASAGSGKTFTLVKEYLKLLLTSEAVFTFQKILAITFTNKAAGEMKERVLHNLTLFSEGKTNDLLAKILEETTLDTAVVKERSGAILHAILQNYSAFSITTIDSFTHKIVKSFAFDLGLTLNFEVEMDAKSLLYEAVDVLISKIGTDKKLTDLLIDFSLSKTDDDTSWDITRELYEISEILLKENDTSHFRKLQSKKLDDFTALQKRLQSTKKTLITALKTLGSQGLAVLSVAAIEHKDFYRGMLPNHFVSLENTPEMAKFFDENKLRTRIEANSFYAKSKSQKIKDAIEAVLPELLQLYRVSEKTKQQLILVKTTLKSVVPLAVLHRINTELTAIKEANNIRLNAEFNQLISDHIKEQPSPFIYERIGQKFNHYFIDEMQDTSALQWQNTIPLVANALSQENSGLLLVGDGKQAIYRWRGGNATQFITLSSEQAAEKPLFSVPKQLHGLTTNYRSYTEVINFNNLFFQHVANFLQKDSYKELFLTGNNQQTTSKKGGFVSLSFLEKEEEKEDNLLKFPKKVYETITQLDASFSLGDVCVLVRGKKEGVAVATYLTSKGMAIVSSETLLIQNSPKVKFITQFLQVIQHPEDQESLLEVLYFLHEHLQIPTNKHAFISSEIRKPLSVFLADLAAVGVSFQLADFYQLPLYEKVALLIRSFRLIETSDAYIQFFLDTVVEQQRKGSNVQEFLQYWELKKEQLSIVAPEASDAVRIMTIHKSKGLEFSVVILPYDVEIYRQNNPKIWLDALPEDPFQEFQELLIPYTKTLEYTTQRGAEIYQEQREELELDNFNLLYVALTRAVEQLYVITALNPPKDEEAPKTYSGVFIDFLREEGLWNPERATYSFGDPKRVGETEKQAITASIQSAFVSSPWQDHHICLLASASKLWDTTQGEAVAHGNLMHEMLSKVYTAADVVAVVSQYTQQGLLAPEATAPVQKNLQEIVAHPLLNTYFSKGLTVFNEREIVTIDHQIYIPDRLVFTANNSVVIIDYKTGVLSKEHHQQLLKYERALQDMGYQVLEKLLVYLSSSIEVVSV